MSVLGRGLESLIPKKDGAPEAPPVLDVLENQARIQEPVYHFHDEIMPGGGLSGPDLPSSNPIAEAASYSPTALEENSALRTSNHSNIRPPRSESIFWIDVSKIEPNPHQPRRNFDVGELTSLAESIRDHGILQPLLVTKQEIDTPSGLDVKYQLIAGERRWRAAKMTGMREVPVIIRGRETPDREKLELALIENVQREDLNPLERARAFERLIGEFGLMQKEVAERIGKSREVVANAMRILRLPQEIQSAIASNLITEGHARALLILENNTEAQIKLFSEIRAIGLTVRDSELAARAGAGVTSRSRRRRSAGGLDPDARDIQKRLEDAFGTRVKLLKQGEHGRIIVEFYSDEELNGILDRIAKREEGYV